MNWFTKLFSKKPKLIPDTEVEDSWDHQKLADQDRPQFEYKNRRMEPEWMVKVRHQTLTPDQLSLIIDSLDLGESVINQSRLHLKYRGIMKKLVIIALMSLFTTCAYAGEIYVTVIGLNCQLCSKSVEKNFKTLPAVDRLHLDLANNFMHIIVKDKQDIPDGKIKSLLLDAGLNVEKIERDYEAKTN